MEPALNRALLLVDVATRKAAEHRRVEVPVSELVLAPSAGDPAWPRGSLRILWSARVPTSSSLLAAPRSLAEMTELIGAEQALAKRAITPELEHRLVEAVRRWERFALEFDEDITGGTPRPGTSAEGSQRSRKVTGLRAQER
jgi:altronate dehydratase large subunit